MSRILAVREVQVVGPWVTPVGGAEVEAFLDVPALVEAGDPAFVTPLRDAVRRELTGAAVPGGALQPFLVTRDGRPAGRASAIVIPRLRDEAGTPVGQIGHLSVADDPGAVRALLDACEGWLRGRGARRVLAPMNGGVHLAHRALVAGFDRPPFLLEPRNPPWLPGLLEGAGYAPVHRWRTWELGREAFVPLQARLAAMGRRGATGAEVVWLDTARDPSGSLARVHALLDRAWSGHIGWAPISLEEFGASFGVLLPLLPPRHAAVLMGRDGRDLGFGLMVPDWIDEVRALRGDASGWGRWMGTAPLPRRAIAHTVAMIPEARGLGAGASLIASSLGSALEQGYEEVVFPLTTETFRFWNHVLPPPTRAYVLYGKGL